MVWVERTFADCGGTESNWVDLNWVTLSPFFELSWMSLSCIELTGVPGRRVAGPFWTQAVNQKNIYKSLHFRPCRSCRMTQKVPTMLPCPWRIPANVLIPCTDKMLRPYDLTYVLAALPVEIWCLDSKPGPYRDVPNDVQASAPHRKTYPSVVCIRFLAMVLSQLQKASLELEYSSCEEYRATPTTNLSPKVVPRWNGIVSEMQHQVSKYDLFILCGGHGRNMPLKTQHG